MHLKKRDMKCIEGGTFQMGDTFGDGYDREKPVHEVKLDTFCICKYQVTQKLYKEIMGYNPSHFYGENRPVENVSLLDAVEFCNKLSKRDGLETCYKGMDENIEWDFLANGYRLPTEAEWEYAARSGGRDDRKWSGTNSESDLGDYAWYDPNSGNETHPVGTKQPNDLGIYDMSGNVWEWCWDWSGDYLSSSQTNPTGPVSGSTRVMRGGDWYYDAGYCRTANRHFDNPSYSILHVGFRLTRR